MSEIQKYTIPKLIRIQRGKSTARLYRLEEKLHADLMEVAKELSKVLKIPSHRLWTQAVPQALFDLLDVHAEEVADATMQGWKSYQEYRASLKRDRGDK